MSADRLRVQPASHVAATTGLPCVLPHALTSPARGVLRYCPALFIAFRKRLASDSALEPIGEWMTR